MGDEMEQTNPFFVWLLATYAEWPWVGLLLGMMILDVASGVAAAIYERKLSSKFGYKGAMKKISVLLVIAVCYLVEQSIISTIPLSMRTSVVLPFAKVAAGFFLFNEALSVLENAKRCGVPLPAFLSKSLVETMGKLSNLGNNAQSETVTLQGVITHKTIVEEKKS